MSWLDIAIIVVIAISTLIGLKIGIIKIVFSLAGLIAGIILAGRYYLPLAEQLSFIPQPSVAKIVAFAIILVGVMLVASVVAALLKWITSVTMLGWVNHLGGAAFGLVLGAIFCGVLLVTWVKFLGAAAAISDSNLAPILVARLPMVMALLPDEFDAVRSFFR